MAATEKLTDGAQLTLYVPRSLKAELQALAAAGNRTVTREVRAALIAHVERQKADGASA